MTKIADEMDELRNAQVYSVTDAAKLCAVHRETMLRWIRAGKIQAAKAGRDYRISRPELVAAWRRMGGGELFEEPTE